jgi:hypothetical protein
MKKLFAFLFLVSLVASFIGGRFYQSKNQPPQPQQFEQPKSDIGGGPGINGFFGVYNSTTPAYYNGQSAAAALDRNARVIISPSSSLTIIGP